MWITLYSDASYSEGKKQATWAVYLRCKLGKLHKAGSCPLKIQDNNEAELYAVLAGIHLAVNTWANIEGFYVRTDSQVVCDLYCATPTRRKGINRLRKAIRALGFPLKIKHVKAHQSGTSTAAYLNNLCDRSARTQHRRKVKPEPSKVDFLA